MITAASRADAPHSPGGSESPRGAFARAAALVRRIIGAPDYASYLRHVAECHPEQTPLAEDEFLDERLDAKYSRPGQRCC
ncbi:MAG TPA: YbdD/YjiX family protein [Gemmatimonadaceae bacterium]|nr:YbdD/YjiX family protein [Gemmatimonadaceae bacterium]